MQKKRTGHVHFISSTVKVVVVVVEGVVDHNVHTNGGTLLYGSCALSNPARHVSPTHFTLYNPTVVPAFLHRCGQARDYYLYCILLLLPLLRETSASRHQKPGRSKIPRPSMFAYASTITAPVAMAEVNPNRPLRPEISNQLPAPTLCAIGEWANERMNERMNHDQCIHRPHASASAPKCLSEIE